MLLGPRFHCTALGQSQLSPQVWSRMFLSQALLWMRGWELPGQGPLLQLSV